MCIFSGAVDTVSSTKILASKVFRTEIVTQKEKGKSHKFKKPVGVPLQLIVYCNKVVLDATNASNINAFGSRGGTAMILPFPLIKGNNRVAVLDMSRYENFFDDIDLMFPIAQSATEQSYEGVFSNSLDSIDVIKVGSYDVSVVPNYENFIRLQFDKFNLHPDVTKLLGQYYARNFGFMVCILRPQARYHPFAYVHELRSNGEMFIPTRHYHGNTNHTVGTSLNSSMGHSVFGKFHDRVNLDDHAEADPSTAHEGLLVDDLYLKNNFYDTLMDGDEYISHQMRRGAKPAQITGKPSKGTGTGARGGTAGKGADTLDWDHDIYIVNRPTVRNDSLLKKPGVSMTSASAGRLDQVSNYIDFRRMPVEIAFGDFKDLVKINISRIYTDNHDLFV
jgi:hypothetical protein